MRMFSKACSLVASSLPRCSSSSPAVASSAPLSIRLVFTGFLGEGLDLGWGFSSGTGPIAAACNNCFGLTKSRTGLALLRFGPSLPAIPDVPSCSVVAWCPCLIIL